MLKTSVMQNSLPLSASPRLSGREKHLQRMQVMAAIVLLTLPFMQLFTIDLGFPLKIYEVAIVLWVGFCFATMQIIVFDRPIFVKGLLLFGYSICALFLILNVFDNVGVHTDLARMGPFLDGALKCAYILLFVFGFDLIANAASREPDRAARLWMYGAMASAALHLTLCFLTAIGHVLPELPGMIPTPRDQQFMYFHGITFFRAGTFTEGNYAGPFFVLSFLIALDYRRYFFAAVFFITAIATFSTTALTTLAIAFGYIMWADRKNLILYLAIIVGTLAILASTSALDTILLEKLSDKDSESSLGNREKTFNNAMGLFEENPLIGVGIEQYGFHKNGSLQWGKKNGADVKLGIMKGIPNNVYMELASEFGLIGIGFFLAFLLPILKLANKGPYPSIRVGGIVILMTWLASPTFALMYYWAFLGLACGIARSRQTQDSVAALADARAI